MDIFQKSLKCISCKDFLASPVLLLPCGNSICHYHVTRHNSAEYNCEVCAVIHTAQDGRFPRVLALESMLEVKIQKAKFCPQYESAIVSCTNFEKTLDEFKLLQSDPAFFINQRIGELKMETDICREEFKMRIDEKANELINQLDEYEQECKKSQHLYRKLDEMKQHVKRVQTQLDSWKLKLNCFDSEEGDWQEIKTVSERETSMLEDKIETYKSDFLLRKLQKYESKLARFATIQLHSDRK
jgi:hypothetical protein